MEDKDNQGTYITDSNVDILIESGGSKTVGNKNNKTDYWPMFIIALIMITIVVIGVMIRAHILQIPFGFA